MTFAISSFQSSLAELCLLVAVFLAMPSLSRPTMPMGVGIPGDRVDEQIIRSTALRFRVAVVCIGLLSVGLAAALSLVSEVATKIVTPVAFVVSVVIAFGIFRNRIVRAKQEGDWFKDAKTRMVATMTAKDTVRPRVRLWPYMASYAVIIVTSLVGWISYGSLPDELPTLWNSDGNVSAQAAKSVTVVFGGILGSAIATSGLLGLAHLMRHVPRRIHPNDAESQARLRADQQHQIGQSLLATVALSTAILASALSMASWAEPNQPLPLVPATIAFFACFGAVTVFQIVTYVMQMREVRRDYLNGASFKDEPDTDQYWFGGLLYLNPNDPAWFVTRRVGIGWAINFGNPAMVITLAVFIFAIVTFNTLSAPQ